MVQSSKDIWIQCARGMQHIAFGCLSIAKGASVFYLSIFLLLHHTRYI